MRWMLWILGGLVLAGGSAAFLIVWWKLGDQWADREYKKFGRRSAGRSDTDAPKTIEDPITPESSTDRASEGAHDGDARDGGAG